MKNQYDIKVIKEGSKMIVAVTKMKKIPDKCQKCPFCMLENVFGRETLRYCSTNGKEIPYEFIKEKRNWCYTKPSWCPLKEIPQQVASGGTK